MVNRTNSSVNAVMFGQLRWATWIPNDLSDAGGFRFAGCSPITAPLLIGDHLTDHCILLRGPRLDLFFDERQEFLRPFRHRAFARVRFFPAVCFASWPGGDAGGAVTVQACAGDGDPVAEAFAGDLEVVVPSEGLAAFGLWVEAEQPALPER